MTRKEHVDSKDDDTLSWTESINEQDGDLIDKDNDTGSTVSTIEAQSPILPPLFNAERFVFRYLLERSAVTFSAEKSIVSFKAERSVLSFSAALASSSTIANPAEENDIDDTLLQVPSNPSNDLAIDMTRTSSSFSHVSSFRNPKYQYAHSMINSIDSAIQLSDFSDASDTESLASNTYAVAVQNISMQVRSAISQYELEDTPTQVADGVYTPSYDRFVIINSYLNRAMPSNIANHQILQELASKDRIILPNIPTAQEKIVYVKTHSRALLAYFIFSLICLSVGMTLFTISYPVFYVFALPTVFVIVYLCLSFYTGMVGKDFDYKQHRQFVDNFVQEVKDGLISVPSVDIYLPCCSEPLYILQNTYEHVVRIDYPNFKVWVLDDGANEKVKELAFKYGFNYIVRPNRPHLKKAGNMRYAFTQTNGDFYMILDADFCPRREFLWECIPSCVRDPKIAVLQTPQYFRVRKNQTWVEQGAGLTQELFYRVIQQKRNRLGGATCVGTSAIYRREALAPFGGLAAIEHSEDIMTGYLAICGGWKVEYLPVCLSMDRWASGSIDLMFEKSFWQSSLPLQTKLCYISGMLYYVTISIAQLVYITPSVLIIYLRPESVRWFNIFFAVPSILVTSVILVAWTSQRYTLNILKAQVVQEYAALFALKDRIFQTQQSWIPSGGRSKSTARFQQARVVLLIYTFASCGLVIGGSIWRGKSYDIYSFIPSIILSCIQFCVSFQFMFNMN